MTSGLSKAELWEIKRLTTKWTLGKASLKEIIRVVALTRKDVEEGMQRASR